MMQMCEFTNVRMCEFLSKIKKFAKGRDNLNGVHTENIIQPLNPYIYGFSSLGNRAGLGGGFAVEPFRTGP